MNVSRAPLLSVLVILALFLPAAATTAQPVHSQAGYSPAATCVVTSKADSGPGTLRDCLSKAVSGSIITFDPAVFPPASPATIALTSQLPTIEQGSITIDGSNAGAILDGSGIGDPQADGVIIASSNNVVRGLQVDALSTHRHPPCGWRGRQYHRRKLDDRERPEWPRQRHHQQRQRRHLHRRRAQQCYHRQSHRHECRRHKAQGNNHNGILLREGASSNRIGGTTPGERNLLSGNQGVGVQMMDPGTENNAVVGNYIGTDVSGAVALPNGGNRHLHRGWREAITGSGGATSGERNVISGNNQNGDRSPDPGRRHDA